MSPEAASAAIRALSRGAIGIYIVRMHRIMSLYSIQGTPWD
jgi:hypothetical protein